jgi:hypothetical protein
MSDLVLRHASKRGEAREGVRYRDTNSAHAIPYSLVCLEMLVVESLLQMHHSVGVAQRDLLHLFPPTAQLLFVSFDYRSFNIPELRDCVPY